MDRNTGIGLTLMALLLVVYFYWFAPAPPTDQPTPVETEQQATEQPAQETAEAPVAVPDSILTSTFGDLSTYMKGEENLTTVNTADLRLEFSNHGFIREAELLKYKTYYQQPLILLDKNSTKLKLTAGYKGQDVDLYSLFYAKSEEKSGDTTVISFKANLSDGTSLTHRYAIPASGYQVQYSIEASGFDRSLTGEQVTYEWNQLIRPTEKDLKDTRNNTTINYYTEDFDKLSESSFDPEREVFNTGPQWLSIKQKYFLSAIIAPGVFKSGEIDIATNTSDTTIVKRANMKLTIAKADVAAGKVKLNYYLGPNDYQMIGDIAPKFSKNVYLGWPPVYWINKFVIFPVFNFLTHQISNYGLIIVVLVILLKLVLAPLSYRSYLSMAKMKVLKPELDEIKAKFPEDMQEQQREQMKLYQQVGVNPLSGCIPVLLQMPILFAMFYLFPASIELRQQSLLWANDLSTYDSLISFAPLPLIGMNHISLFTVMMTVSTLIYTWQNNQLSSVTGPMKSMSYMMPVVFFFVLNSFSAGLTFYYFVSNLATFAQQAIIKRFVNEGKIRAILDENRKRIASGNSKKSKFMQKLEDAMKASEEARKASEEQRKNRKSGKK